MNELIDTITSVVHEKYNGHIIRVEQHYDFPVFILKSGNIIEIIAVLKEHASTQLQYLTTLCAIHYADEKQIAVMYQLHNMLTNERIRLKVFLPEEKPELPSLTGVFPAANWMERETFDFFGVVFKGHPNLKRILNVEDMIIHPLRKEFPLEDQEKLIGAEIPRRVQYMRVIIMELARITDHLICNAVIGVDTGALTGFVYMFQQRELVYEIYEEICGARLTTNIGRI